MLRSGSLRCMARHVPISQTQRSSALIASPDCLSLRFVFIHNVIYIYICTFIYLYTCDYVDDDDDDDDDFSVKFFVDPPEFCP